MLDDPVVLDAEDIDDGASTIRFTIGRVDMQVDEIAIGGAA